MATQPPNQLPTGRVCARCRKLLDAAAQDAFHSMYCGECSRALKAAVQRLQRSAPPAANPAPVHDSPRAAAAIKPEPPPIPLATDVLLVPAEHGPAAVRAVPAPPPE